MSTEELVKLPEDEELARLKARLDELEDELADRELDLATLRRELLDFDLRFRAIVGTRMAELDRLEAEIAAIFARAEPTPEAQQRADESAARAQDSAADLGDDPDALAQAAEEPERVIPPDLKKLFRTVAKAVHPDLAVDDDDRTLRDQFMTQANAAYERGDVEALQTLLIDWEAHPQAVTGEGIGAELIRLIRSIAAAEKRLAAIAVEIAGLRTGRLYELYEQAQEMHKERRDLLQEMAASLDEKIEAARRKLVDLQAASPEAVNQDQSAPETHDAEDVDEAPVWPEFVAVSCGFDRTCAVGNDGSLWAWGSNKYGELCIGDETERTTPARIGDADGWVAVDSGLAHLVALKRDGSLWTWGGNEDGQLGLGDRKARLSPTRVGDANDWTEISAGERHTVALKRDGSLWGWGGGLLAQLGLGDHAERHAPSQIDRYTAWTAVSAGWHHTVALRWDGTIRAWGGNVHGQLGVDDSIERLLPASIGVSSDWAAISAGLNHTLGLMKDGGLWAWGDNEFGQLGAGDHTARAAPSLVGDVMDWTAISAGQDYSLGLRSDGSLWAWGRNADGELGVGGGPDALSPVQVGEAKDWTALSAGTHSSIGVRSDGSLWAWGLNEYGQLGLGDTEGRDRPACVARTTAPRAHGSASHVPPITTPRADESLSSSEDDSAERGLCHPVVGRFPPGSVPLIVPYEMAQVEIADAVSNLAQVPTAQLAAWLVEVVDVESPIHMGEASRRVAQAAGVRRVGHLIRAAIEAAAHAAAQEHSLVVQRDFLWSLTRTEMVVRDRSTSSPSLRHIEIIPDEEIEWAACAVLSSLGCVAENSLPRPVTRVLGFERTSSEACQRVRAAVARGLEAGAFVRVGMGVALASPHGKPASAVAHPTPVGRTRADGTRPYQVARPILELEHLQFHELPQDYLASALQDVVTVESPIHLSEATRRLANAAGLQRAGQRIRAAVSAACALLERQGLVERRDGFLWDPGGVLVVRDRSEAPSSLRDVDMVSPEEILEAAHVSGAERFGNKDATVKTVARLLGFRRTGNDVREAILNVLLSPPGADAN